MKKNIGVWMDSTKAFIIHDNEDRVETILSEMEHFHFGGGSGDRDALSEPKLEERKKHQMKSYFENVKNHISAAQNIVIFGPGEIKIAFKKDIEQHPDLKAKLRAVETASNKLTENQLKEWVRNFYAK